MMVQNTKDAVEILERLTGDDPALCQMIEEETLSAQVARLLCDARTCAKLTQKQLADRVGTPQSTIARLEDAEYKGHSLAMLRRILAALDQPIGEDLTLAKQGLAEWADALDAEDRR